MTFDQLKATTQELLNAEKKAETVKELQPILHQQQSLLDQINRTFETGFFAGNAYDTLWNCKGDLISLQRKINAKAIALFKAGTKSAETVYNEI